MATLPDGKHMLSNIQWRRRDEDGALRPLRGFTTGTLYVEGSTNRVTARFTDQNLSNRFSDLEQDGIRVTLQVSLLGEPNAYRLLGDTPTLERAGACYILRLTGQSEDLSAVHAAA